MLGLGLTKRKRPGTTGSFCLTLKWGFRGGTENLRALILSFIFRGRSFALFSVLQYKGVLKVEMVGTEKRLKDLEERVLLLEQGRKAGNDPSVLEMDLILPEADVGGLHFNETRVHVVFKQQDDGWYQSRDILFLSARNVADDNSMDALTEYLNDGGIRMQVAARFNVHPADIIVSLPEKGRGVKKYNGVDWWYWLADPCAGSAACFFNVGTNGGSATGTLAYAVGGCAPAFRVVQGGNR
jgi:hypothetical protein